MNPPTRRREPRSSWFGPVEPSSRETVGDGLSAEAHHNADSGRAIIEVIFLAVLLLIPIVYILISVFRLQSATFAVSQAARDAGRAMDAAPGVDEGLARARQIITIDLADQNIPDRQLTLRFVAPGADCRTGNAVPPSLDGGSSYDVCVTAVITLPGVPTILTGPNNTVTGVYTVHIGDLREGS